MRHFLNGIEITPRNRNEIGVVSDFSGNPEILNLNTESVILPREAMDIIKQHILAVGLFEGIPYKVELSGNVSIDYYIDLTNGVKIRQHEIEVNLLRRKAIETFKTNADGTSFELMLSKGVIFDTKKVPYFIIKDNQLETAITLAISTYIMTKELIQATVEVVTAITDLINASAPIPGLSPAGPTVSYNVSAIIIASLKVIARLAYFAAILIAVINLAGQLFSLLFPPKRNLLGCSFYELLEKSCNFLGYTFASDLLTNDPYWNLCPVPLVRGNQSIFEEAFNSFTGSFNKGVPSSSDTTPTVGTFIDACLTMFNGQLIVRNGEVRLERRDWLANQSTNVILPALSLQSERDDEYYYNTEDIWKRYYIHYAVDFSDVHTCEGDMYKIHDSEYSTEPNFTITNSDLVTIKGLNEVTIPFALAARKDKLNWIELLAKGFFTLVDSVTGVFGGGTNYAPQIGERKKAMKISQQYFSTTKVLYAKPSEFVSGSIVQGGNYGNNCSAHALWRKYHYINQIQDYEFIIKENCRVRLSSQDFVTLLNNNFADIDGVVSEILKIEWIDEKSFAQITFRQPSNWASGKVITTIINE
jgi:hypothetical protein